MEQMMKGKHSVLFYMYIYNLFSLHLCNPHNKVKPSIAMICFVEVSLDTRLRMSVVL